jgi:hypothetical protein
MSKQEKIMRELAVSASRSNVIADLTRVRQLCNIIERELENEDIDAMTVGAEVCVQSSKVLQQAVLAYKNRRLDMDGEQ